MLNNRLTGRRALVTAAGQGIGRAIAERLALEDASVLATDINEKALSELDGVDTARLDVLDKAAIEALAAKTKIDILINCAGFVAHGDILSCSEKDWTFSLDLNVTAMYRMCRAFLPSMLENGHGSIVNISSVASSIVAANDRFAYGATKAAVIGMTKAIAVDYVGQGVRCNAICPGTIQSPSLDDRINAFDDPVAARKAFIARQPMGRLGKAKEVASLAAYLASDEAAFTTGAIHTIDGGWTVA